MPIRMSCSYERTAHACNTLKRFYEPTDASQEAATVAIAALCYGPHGSRRTPSLSKHLRIWLVGAVPPWQLEYCCLDCR